jgi:hypothetical protein
MGRGFSRALLVAAVVTGGWVVVGCSGDESSDAGPQE